MAELDVYIEAVHERRRKRRFYWILSAALFGAYGILFITAWIFLKAPIFQVRTLAIRGNTTVGEGQVRDLLRAEILGKNWKTALLGFDNLLIWPSELSGRDLLFLPAVKKLSIEKNYKTRNVDVVIEERQPYATWCLMSKGDPPVPTDCFWFDDTGTMFKRALATQGNLIVSVHDYSQGKIGVNSSVLSRELVSNLISVLDTLTASGVGTKEIRLNDLGLEELEVDTWIGPKLYFSLHFAAQDIVPVIQSLASKGGFKNLQYVDFRVEKRVYYK